MAGLPFVSSIVSLHWQQVCLSALASILSSLNLPLFVCQTLPPSQAQPRSHNRSSSRCTGIVHHIHIVMAITNRQRQQRSSTYFYSILTDSLLGLIEALATLLETGGCEYTKQDIFDEGAFCRSFQVDQRVTRIFQSSE